MRIVGKRLIFRHNESIFHAVAEFSKKVQQLVVALTNSECLGSESLRHGQGSPFCDIEASLSPFMECCELARMLLDVAAIFFQRFQHTAPKNQGPFSSHVPPVAVTD